MKKIALMLLVIPFLSIVSCENSGKTIDREQGSTINIPQLIDSKVETSFIGETGVNKIQFSRLDPIAPKSYVIHSSGESPLADPSSWVLKGSNDGVTWTEIDKQVNQKFISRFQEKIYYINNPSSYKKFLFEMESGNSTTKLRLADVNFYDYEIAKDFKNFHYPEVKFENLAPNTRGSKLYLQLVQDPEEYIRYHTKKVAEILYFSSEDPIPPIKFIGYTLEDTDGISAKGGSPETGVTVFYSTRHIEKSATQSLEKLDYETRGVLYHELVHAYQYEPKNTGDTYGDGGIYWSCIEGLADAVRIEAELVNMTERKAGGSWTGGYKQTGFFIHWLTNKDPDAIRKFNASARDLETWTYDDAVKYILGDGVNIESLWNEYQASI